MSNPLSTKISYKLMELNFQIKNSGETNQNL